MQNIYFLPVYTLDTAISGFISCTIEPVYRFGKADPGGYLLFRRMKVYQ